MKSSTNQRTDDGPSNVLPMNRSHSPAILALLVLYTLSIFIAFLAVHGPWEAVIGTSFYYITLLSALLTTWKLPWLVCVLPIVLFLVPMGSPQYPSTLRGYLAFSAMHAMSRVLDLVYDPSPMHEWTLAQKWAHTLFLTDLRYAIVMGPAEGHRIGYIGKGLIWMFLWGAFGALGWSWAASFPDDARYVRVLGFYAFTVGLLQGLDGTYQVLLALVGLRPDPIMLSPLFAHSLANFWQRWNQPVRRVFRTYGYQRAKKVGYPTKIAVLWTFFISGFYHAVAMFVAGVPWAMVMACLVIFLCQAFGMFFEDFVGIKRLPRLVGWIWMLAYNLTVTPMIILWGWRE